MGLSPDALFLSLCSDVGYSDPSSLKGIINTCTTYRSFAQQYLLHSAVRKWIPEDARAADRAALDSFTFANNKCRDWSLPPEEWEIDRVFYGEFRRILDRFFHPEGKLLVESVYDLNIVARPGPGVAVAACGTSYYTKFFNSRLTAGRLRFRSVKVSAVASSKFDWAGCKSGRVGQ
jgi:hypothetical protein